MPSPTRARNRTPRMTTMTESAPPFRGFPAGAQAVPLPAALLSSVIPVMTDTAELLVTLYALGGIQRLRRFPRLLDVADLRAQRPLIEALAALLPDEEPALTLKRGLDAALARGTLLLVEARGPDGPRRLLAVNSAADRRTVERLQRDELSLGGPVALLPAAPRREQNIHQLYERSIAPITPLIAEQLAEAERTYPWPWILAAFREAEELNKRSWRYVSRILERWQREGRTDAPPGRHPRRKRDSKYEHLLRR